MPALLLQQVLRAHHIFLVHHSFSLTELFSRVSREKFCGFLKRFWNEFLWRWDVLLHGNPAVDIYNGIKLSAGGELGIGVGEEDWGSGEREVLEGFIERTDGLVDLIVSRFEQAPERAKAPAQLVSLPIEYSGTREYPQSSDGLIFSGVGALTRPSIKNVSAWVEWIATHGADAYGIRDNPPSGPRRKRTRAEGVSRATIGVRKRSHELPRLSRDPASASSGISSAGIPAPIVSLNGGDPRGTGAAYTVANGSPKRARQQDASEPEGNSAATGIMKYLSFGVYGSSWGIPSGRSAVHRTASDHRADNEGKSSNSSRHQPRERNTSNGYFLVGLLGDLEDDGASIADSPNQAQNSEFESDTESKGFNSRILMRYLYVERIKPGCPKEAGYSPRTHDNVNQVSCDRLRVVVYISQPFIFTFLFEPQTDSLAIPSFYRSLHHQLGPLQRPLLKSTDPDKVSQRLWDAASTRNTALTHESQPIRDLVYDPARLTVHASIPNIPELSLGSSDIPSNWTRVEALSVHSQILNTYVATRRHGSELERTCKTSRGWWVVWMRLPHPPTASTTHSSSYREAFLIRKASDYATPKPRTSSLGFGRNDNGKGALAEWGPARLAEGIGIDAKQYIHGLLSLNR